MSDINPIVVFYSIVVGGVLGVMAERHLVGKPPAMPAPPNKINVQMTELEFPDGSVSKVARLTVDGDNVWLIQGPTGRWVAGTEGDPPVVEPKEYH